MPSISSSTVRVEPGGLDLVVHEAGEGPAVLLLHGFPDDHQVWRKQIPVLAQAGYRVIAPDLRGCGQSGMPPLPTDYELPRLVADLVAILDRLEIERAAVIAHDWGAVIGWHFAIAHPERVNRYAALSVGHPTAYARSGIIQKLKGYYVLLFILRGIAERMLQAGDWWFLRVATGAPEEAPRWIARLSAPGRLTAALNYYRANALALLRRDERPKVAVPVLGLSSDGDRFLAEDQMKHSARYCSGGFRFERIEGAGHWLQLDASERVNVLLVEFLNQGREG